MLTLSKLVKRMLGVLNLAINAWKRARQAYLTLL